MRLFVVYIDILGFGRVIGDIARRVYLTSEEIKQKWKDKINISLKKWKRNNLLTAFDEISLDSWVIFTKAADDVYRLLENLSSLELPLEIAIHFENFKESSNLKLSDQMMHFLKSNILGDYREWFKKRYKKSIEETFIIATEQAYSALGSDNFWKRPYLRAKYYLFVKQKASTISTIEYLIAGRREEIELFRRLLKDRRNYYGLWIYGPGGIGKSALIRQCCLIAKTEKYRIIGDRDKIIRETPTQYFIRVCGFEKESYKILESTYIKSEILAKLIEELSENTIVVIDASEDFEDYDGLTDFIESFIERLKSLDDRVFLLVGTRRSPKYTPSYIHLVGLRGLNTEEIKEFIELKGGDKDLKKYAKTLREKTGGWPLVLEVICSSP